MVEERIKRDIGTAIEELRLAINGGRIQYNPGEIYHVFAMLGSPDKKDRDLALSYLLSEYYLSQSQEPKTQIDNAVRYWGVVEKSRRKELTIDDAGRIVVQKHFTQIAKPRQRVSSAEGIRFYQRMEDFPVENESICCLALYDSAPDANTSLHHKIDDKARLWIPTWERSRIFPEKKSQIVQVGLDDKILVMPYSLFSAHKEFIKQASEQYKP